MGGGEGVFQQHDLPDAALLFVLASARVWIPEHGAGLFLLLSQRFPPTPPTLFCVDLSSSSSPLSGNRVQTAVRGVEMAGGGGGGESGKG